MTGGHAIAGLRAGIAKAQVLLKIALLHRVRVHAESNPAGERPVQPLGADAGEHRFEIASVQAVELILPEPAHMRRLQIRQGKLRAGHVFPQIRAYPRHVT